MMLIVKFYMLEIVHFKIHHQRLNIKDAVIYKIIY